MKRFFYPRVNSTNSEAKRLFLNESTIPPFWVVTDEQFQGRGHGNNSWESAPGLNFSGTLVISPKSLKAHQQFVLSQLICLALKSFLELFVDGVKIKWPNDIYVNDNKVSGVLIENEIIGDQIARSYIGIGVNINQVEFKTDAPNPESLKGLTGIDYNVEEMTHLITGQVERYIKLLADSQIEDTQEQYLKSLYRFKQYAPYRANTHWFEARIVGIGEFGELILEDKSGEKRQYGFKEVEFILA